MNWTALFRRLQEPSTIGVLGGLAYIFAPQMAPAVPELASHALGLAAALYAIIAREAPDVPRVEPPPLPARPVRR